VTFIRTVLGDIEPQDLGPTYAHEHLVIDGGGFVEASPDFLLAQVDTAVAELEAPRALGLAASHQQAMAQLLSRLQGWQTLTVADFAGFVGRGGAVELFLDEGRVRFRIDRDAAQAAGLVLRSQLLRAAATVKET
jgi:hypothetical protein